MTVLVVRPERRSPWACRQHLIDSPIIREGLPLTVERGVGCMGRATGLAGARSFAAPVWAVIGLGFGYGPAGSQDEYELEYQESEITMHDSLYPPSSDSALVCGLNPPSQRWEF